MQRQLFPSIPIILKLHWNQLLVAFEALQLLKTRKYPGVISAPEIQQLEEYDNDNGNKLVANYIAADEEEFDLGDENQFDFSRSKQGIGISHCRNIMYEMLNALFKLSRYLESYYFHDDVLAVNNDQILPILTLFD